MTPTGAGPATGRDALLARAIAWFAEHGIGDTSLRGIAAAVGTSHRMLIHHFGSRDGLLDAVVIQVEAGHRASLAALLAAEGDPLEIGWRFWQLTCEAGQVYGPLLFELIAHAAQGRAHALPLRAGLIDDWIEPLAQLWVRAGVPADEAAARARLDLAVARGLLQDLLLTGDRAAVDAAMRQHVAAASHGLPRD